MERQSISTHCNRENAKRSPVTNIINLPLPPPQAGGVYCTHLYTIFSRQTNFHSMGFGRATKSLLVRARARLTVTPTSCPRRPNGAHAEYPFVTSLFARTIHDRDKPYSHSQHFLLTSPVTFGFGSVHDERFPLLSLRRGAGRGVRLPYGGAAPGCVHADAAAALRAAAAAAAAAAGRRRSLGGSCAPAGVAPPSPATGVRWARDRARRLAQRAAAPV